MILVYYSSTARQTNSQNSEEPLVILKRRFALGEITEEEYQRMRKILEG
ncbi:MAG: SHOCT domain-containing protein [Thermoproteota archaeon]|nr:SHOCT domain-containing protein [Thermoproteota archaeon]